MAITILNFLEKIIYFTEYQIDKIKFAKNQKKMLFGKE